MKKILILITIMAAFAFTTQNEKLLKVELPFNVWTHHFQKLQTVRGYIDKTNLPHSDVEFILGTIDSLTMDLSKQLLPQIDTAKKK